MYKSIVSLACAGIFLLWPHASAQVLLTINDTDPSHVIITATGANAGANVNAFLSDGVDLLGFFTSTTGAVAFTVDTGVSNLTSSNNTGGDVFTDSLSDIQSGPNVDLNLYNASSSAAENFSTTSIAFTGSLTVDLSGSASLLRSSGSGNIMSGYFADTVPPGQSSPNVIIGTYQIVTTSAPEPSTWALLFGGLGLLAIYRLRLNGARVGSLKD